MVAFKPPLQKNNNQVLKNGLMAHLYNPVDLKDILNQNQLYYFFLTIINFLISRIWSVYSYFKRIYSTVCWYGHERMNHTILSCLFVPRLHVFYLMLDSLMIDVTSFIFIHSILTYCSRENMIYNSYYQERIGIQLTPPHVCACP